MGNEVLSAPPGDPAAHRQAAEASHTAVRPLADPSFVNDKASTSTVPEDGDEEWTDAPEPADTDDAASETQQGVNSDGRSSRTNILPPSGLSSAIDDDEIKDTEISEKNPEETASMSVPTDDPPPPSP